MNTKANRLTKIKNFLRHQSSPSTVTEIYEALNNRMSEDISRKTVERDLLELIELEHVGHQKGIPSLYFLTKPSEIEIILKIDEIKTILE